jgi:hypothetical protein
MTKAKLYLILAFNLTVVATGLIALTAVPAVAEDNSLCEENSWCPTPFGCEYHDYMRCAPSWSGCRTC